MKRVNEDSIKDIKKEETTVDEGNSTNSLGQASNGTSNDDDKNANDHQEGKQQDPAEHNGHSSQVELNPAKRRCSDAEEIRLLVPSKIAGGIIGKAGCNIQKLRNDYDARIHMVDSRGSPDRVLTISASLEECGKVLKELLVHLEKDTEDVYDLRFLIHHSLAGCIIGKQGATVKALREQFGCNVKVFPECAPNSSDRVVQIIGKEDQCIETFLEIFGKLTINQMIRGKIMKYDAEYHDPSYALKYGGYQGTTTPRDNRNRFNGRQKGNSRFVRSYDPSVNPWVQLTPNVYQASNQGYQNGSTHRPPVKYQQQYATEQKMTTQVSIKSDMVGALIGCRGARINEIRMQSRAMIQIDNPKRGSSTERIITITGTSGQIQTAQYMLQQCIRNYCMSDNQ